MSAAHERNWLVIKVGSLADGGEDISHDNGEEWKEYMLALYFIVQTFTSVGYGDVNP
jgi:hypothetical protein